MTTKPPLPRLKRDWEGRYVQLRTELRTKGGTIFERGEIMLVTRNHGGLHLDATIRCQHCSRRSNYKIKEVHEAEVELLPPEYTPPPGGAE